MPLATVRDYENYIARLRAIPAYFDQHVEHMREGLQDRLHLRAVALDGYDVTMRPHVVSDPEKSVFWKPFVSFPAGVPASEHERLRAAGREAIAQSVAPAYQRLLEFITREYLPGARTTLGASELPEGKAYYAWLVQHFTTLDITPEQVHADRPRRGGAHPPRDGRRRAEGRLQGHVPRVPRVPAHRPALLRQDARRAAEAGRLDREADGRQAAVALRTPAAPALRRRARARRPRARSTRAAATSARRSTAAAPGTYWVNTYALETRPLYELEALTLHEAVPGHHLQMALAQELTGLPEFRRYAYVNAFGEGWGLYSERLGIEAGFYQDPYSDFGRLTYEMWRACRLVVDTGIHAMGWTRQQAIDYMAERTALSRHEIATEVDRYISWPGQALAYKMGELKIRELRARAEKELGTRFDVRAFHDAVLANGSVPLDVLERQIDDWIAGGEGLIAPRRAAELADERVGPVDGAQRFGDAARVDRDAARLLVGEEVVPGERLWMLPSNTMPTNSPLRSITGLPELPPMMSFVEVKLSGVSSFSAPFFSCQRGVSAQGAWPACAIERSSMP